MGICRAGNSLGHDQSPLKPSVCDNGGSADDVICIDDDDDDDGDANGTEVCAAKKCLKPSGDFFSCSSARAV
jgi:hypothetical protein